MPLFLRFFHSVRPATTPARIIADWAVCLHAAHPGYISWEEFMANQRRLADNVLRYEAGHSSVPRKEAACCKELRSAGVADGA
jgi:hypothetical protein